MFLEAGIISFIVAWLRGGRLREDPGLRAMWLAPAAFGLQLVNLFFVPVYLNILFTAASYGMLLYFACLNLTNQSVRIILIGMVLNVLVIFANGGRMPVDLQSARAIGMEVDELVSGVAAKHMALTSDSRLPFLADVIPIRYPIPRLISAGDICAVIGAFFLVQDLMGKPIRLRSEEVES